LVSQLDVSVNFIDTIKKKKNKKKNNFWDFSNYVYFIVFSFYDIPVDKVRKVIHNNDNTNEFDSKVISENYDI